MRSVRAEARGKKPHTELNPDEVVALGAAVQAQILAGGSKATEDLLLLDVTPLSLGIEALGGVVAKIIQRNSTIPASAVEHFTTGVDGQTNVAIHVVQGEREMAKDCRSLARFDLKGIPPMVAGLPRIEVKFLIDANGILHVSAREQRSGQAAEVEVKPTYGLTDEQVETMILDSFDFAEQDLEERQVIEAKNEAETILDGGSKKARSTRPGRCFRRMRLRRSSRRRSTTELEASLKGGDFRMIRRAIEGLDKATTRFAELMMDSAVGGAMQGKTMGAAGESMGSGPPSCSAPVCEGRFSGDAYQSRLIPLKAKRRRTSKTSQVQEKSDEGLLCWKRNCCQLWIRSKPVADGIVRVTFLPEGKTVEFQVRHAAV